MENEIMTVEEALQQAERIAKTGSTEEKESFVSWCCAAIAWNSSQCGINEEARENLAIVQKQYKAYLNALPKN